jgi:hypothetical protein
MGYSSEIDPRGVSQVAEAMISVRGGDAKIEAHCEAVEALSHEDLSGFRGWHRIYKAIRSSLQNQ